ncbi:MAG: ABC transporter permease subunit [Phycisphaerales bacterium]|jgi:phosphate transport system permease protein
MSDDRPDNVDQPQDFAGVPARPMPGGGAVPTNKPATIERRSTPPSALGEPMIWLTGAALVVSLVMIVGLVAMIVTQGLTTFWPRPIERVTLNDGTVFLGVPTDTEADPAKTLYRTGNRDIGTEPFRWVPESDVVEVERPQYAVMLEREAWSVWMGVPEKAIEIAEDGEPTVVAEGPEAVMAFIEENHGEARERYKEIEGLKKHGLGGINQRIEALRLSVREAEIAATRTDRPADSFGMPVFAGVVVLGLGAFGFAWWVGRDHGPSDTPRLGGPSKPVRLARMAAVAVGVTLLLAAWLHAPWQNRVITDERLAEILTAATEREAELQARYDDVLARIADLEVEDERLRLEVVDPRTGRFAPARQIEPDNPMRLSQIVRVVDANDMGLGDKVGVFLSRWWEFLAHPPREANTEGGVFPVIVGTVMLTLLLTITVTPLGVIAALYLREYAPQGVVTSTIRIAVNNLAGVPSIVYGVFGLGFFCYTVGKYVDVGSDPSLRLPAPWWWVVLGGTVLALVAAYASSVWSKPIPGKEESTRNIALKWVSRILWLSVFISAAVLVVRTPYFTGFFEARAADGSPTFGSRGMLWAALTLALLTLPVVIVSTEEAIAAVPNSMREGSYGCGASKWQTMRRIVLPGAMPGILTGAILAMARGAGEVAPLMLVGAVKLNEDLPISTNAPFLHLDRSFMHLGFHIYDLGFQSPDSQAARPLVWTTTLLLLVIVVSLNLVAIIIRARLRARLTG